MRVFDRIDPSDLDRRELQLWILALTVILILAMGVGLLMYPTVYSRPLNVTGFPVRAIFFGFCGLSALLVGYFIDRQVVIRHLRAELEKEKRHVVQIRQEASADLLTTLPGLSTFRDRLLMEHRRASNARQPLSLLTVELRPSRDLSGPEEIEIAFGDSAKTLMRKLRAEDSIFLLAPGVFGIILPALAAGRAYTVRDRLMEGLHDAAGASNRFSFSVSVVNFPEHVASAQEMEKSIQCFFPIDAGKNANFELVTARLGIE